MSLSAATIRSLLLAAVTSTALLTAAHAQQTPPIFSCTDAPFPTSGSVSGANIGTVLNTVATDASDRSNQTRWEWSNTFLATSTAPASIPAGTWTYFTGNEQTPPAPSWPAGLADTRIGFYPGSAWGHSNNQLHFFRYRFNLAAEVDPASFALTLNGLSADDQLRGVYLNGALVSGPLANGSNLTIDNTAPWQSGANELTIAIFDTNSSAVAFRMAGSSGNACSVLLAPALDLLPPATITTTQIASLNGTTEGVPDGTTVTLEILDPVTLNVLDTITTTVTGNTYSAPANAPLPVGNYPVRATITPASGSPLTDTETLTVIAMPVPAVAQPVPAVSAIGLTLMAILLAGLASGLCRRKLS